MDNKQLLLIVLAIIIAGLIISVGCFYGLSQNKNTTDITNSDNTTNTTATINNTADTTNDPIEHISNDEKVATQSSSNRNTLEKMGNQLVKLITKQFRYTVKVQTVLKNLKHRKRV